MFHAFFRFIFRVLPLLLLLSPVNSSSCAMGNKTTEIRVKYENILSHDINELKGLLSLKSVLLIVDFLTEVLRSALNRNAKRHKPPPAVNISAEYHDRCCKNKRRENSKVFFCNDTQEIESLQSMACNMLRFFNKRKIIKDFRWKATLVSCGTLQVLQCKCERHKKEKVCMQVNTYNKSDTEATEQSRRRCNQEFCELKENISRLRSCWNKFEKIIFR